MLSIVNRWTDFDIFGTKINVTQETITGISTKDKETGM